jgi:hypothetical protein
MICPRCEGSKCGDALPLVVCIVNGRGCCPKCGGTGELPDEEDGEDT